MSIKFFATTPGQTRNAMNESDRRAVAAWLLLCAAMVFAIVVVGGITRLARSGLSIAEWQPHIGAPAALAAAHQAGAVLLLAVALIHAHGRAPA
jgi:heme A synthase